MNANYGFETGLIASPRIIADDVMAVLRIPLRDRPRREKRTCNESSEFFKTSCPRGKRTRNMSERHGKAGGQKDDWMKIELFAPAEMIDALTNFMTDIGAQGAYQEVLEPQSPNDFPETSSGEVLKAFLPFDVRLSGRLAALQTYIDSLSEIFPDLGKPHFRTESIHDPDWGEAWKKYFKPLRVSRNIVIKPTWERFSPTGRDIVIEIDPGMAFGTGQHASTRMCLDAIEEILLKDRSVDRWRVLDVGTGTGILGIACAKLGAEKVLCVDIDKQAIEIARENARINQVEDRVEIRYCDVATLTDSFHLILANLTAKILIKLRSHLVRQLLPGGYLVISGIIEQNKPDIETYFPGDSFVLHRLITEKEWLCYVLKHRGDRP